METITANRQAFNRFVRTLLLAVVTVVTISGAALSQPTPREDDNFSVTKDLKLPVYVWRNPDKDPKAIIIGCHGGCLYGRAYRFLGEKLADENFLFVSMDLRGFGKYYHNSYGSKRDKKVHYKHSMVDFYLVIKELRKEYPGTPVYALGESLGANIALYLAMSRPDLVDGVVAVSPFDRPKYFFSLYHFIAIPQAMFLPWTKINLDPYLSKRLTSDIQMSEEEVNDPMNRNHQTAIELFKCVGWMYRGRRLVNSIPDTKPILFVCDQKDKLCDENGSRLLFNSLKSKDKTYIQIKDNGHLLVEKSNIHPDTLAALIGWLNERTSAYKLSLADSRLH